MYNEMFHKEVDMNKKFDIMKNNKGFIAALDQSGGSTPKALLNYGVTEDKYDNEDKMFELVHEMRTRIIKAKAFNKDSILGAILFEQTMNSKIDGKFTADYLWEEKGILGFLKVDKGLDTLENDVQLMKPNPGLKDLLKVANERNIFGTKMRSVIKEFNEVGIKEIVKQQFETGKIIIEAGLVPIIEPEVDINSKTKKECEALLKTLILEELNKLNDDQMIMLKLTLPEEDNFYKELVEHKNVVRVVALSGGYSREFANERLANNNGMIASFSRALSEGLNVNQTQEEFEDMIANSIKSIYDASIK